MIYVDISEMNYVKKDLPLIRLVLRLLKCLVHHSLQTNQLYSVLQIKNTLTKRLYGINQCQTILMILILTVNHLQHGSMQHQNMVKSILTMVCLLCQNNIIINLAMLQMNYLEIQTHVEPV